MTFPRTEWRQGGNPEGQNGENTFWGFWANVDAYHPEPVMAEEAAEWGQKHKYALIGSALPAAGLIWAAFTVSWLFGLLAPIAYMLVYVFVNHYPPLVRQREFFGHAVGIQDGLRNYPDADMEGRYARKLLDPFYPEFKGWTEEQTLAGLRAAYPQAKAWLRANRKRLDKINAARPNV